MNDQMRDYRLVARSRWVMSRYLAAEFGARSAPCTEVTLPMVEISLTKKRRVGAMLAVLAGVAMTVAVVAPVADAQRARARPSARSFIYALCGPNVCRIDARTRRSTIVLRRATDKEYTSISASPSGSTLAFVYDGEVFRSGRDGRGRRELDQGGYGPYGLSVSPNGRDVAWFARVDSQQCFTDFNFNYVCTPVTYTYLYSQGLSDGESEAHGKPSTTAGWYRAQLVAQTEPEEGNADYICVIDEDGDCTRTLAQDPARAYSSPSTSPDGRYLAVVSEPVPPEQGDMDFQGRIEIWNAANGRKVRDLTQGTKDDTPIFSPDGKSVAFQRGRDIMARSVKGGRPKLIKRGAELTGPSWTRGR